MLLPCRDALHSGENFLSPAQSLSQTAVQKVQHAGLFLCSKFYAWMEDPSFLTYDVLIEATQCNLQHAKKFSRRNELVQDRDAGSVRPALASSFLLEGQPCRH